MIRLSSALTLVAFVLSSLAQGASAQTAQTPAARGRAQAPATRGRAQAAAPAAAVPEVQKSPGAGPLLVIETAKGVIQIETYPADAPKTVEHVLGLAKRNFYNGQRVHRVEPGFVVQFGDPQSRDATKRDRWGTGGSGRAIGVAETKRVHKLGAVAMAHAGDPARADSQMYILLRPTAAALDGKYAVFGQVVGGMDVVQKIAVGDVIRRISVK
jgi:cyclophilin family peptidyl-prolyl cis-trans isomerase